MAEDKEDRSREDLTEEASPHRVEEYRKKGMVAQSRDITGLAVLLAAGSCLYLLAPKFGQDISNFMKEVFQSNLTAKLNLDKNQIIRIFLIKSLWIFISIGLPVGFAGFILGAMSSLVQTGVIFSFDPITPKFEKIDPIQGIKKYLSLKHLFDGLRVFLKLAITLVISYKLIKSEILVSPASMGSDIFLAFGSFSRCIKSISFSLLIVFAIFAFIDYGFQKYEFSKNLKMTKQEAKQEFKEREGDPQIRARIRSVQREMARRRMMQAVKKADVVITNPTHIAVALVYDTTRMSAPKVVAKGADFVAQRIKQIALDSNVPTVENVPLARTLYKTVKIGHSIPHALYQAVAEVLAYVYKLKKGKL